MEKIIHPAIISGTLQVPASKSDAQRAILAAALADGQISRIHHPGQSKDVLAMLHCVERLGAKVNWEDENTVAITGGKVKDFGNHLEVGESGLALRLLTSICSLFNKEIILLGEGSLKQRSHDFFKLNLPNFGVEVLTNNGHVPIKVLGPLQGCSTTVDACGSSQTISGLLMALPLAGNDSTIKVENLTSRPYLDMTIHTLNKFGILVQEPEKDCFFIAGNQKYLNCDYDVEGDWSSASYWLVAQALGSTIDVEGLNMSSLQADKMLLNALVSSGCKINYTENGLQVDGTERIPLDFDATDCPDLFPALVTYAALTMGISKIKGVHRLSNKESNRGLALQEEFGKLGVEITLSGDEMYISGKGTISGGKVEAHNDHRIAMCLAIAALFAESEITLSGAEAVAKSYPDFWEQFDKLRNFC